MECITDGGRIRDGSRAVDSRVGICKVDKRICKDHLRMSPQVQSVDACLRIIASEKHACVYSVHKGGIFSPSAEEAFHISEYTMRMYMQDWTASSIRRTRTSMRMR